MFFVDTHTHLYLDEFDQDRDDAICRAVRAGVMYMLLPNIDRTSIEPMHRLCDAYPGNCFPMMGLHPTSVGAGWRDELAVIEENLRQRTYYAIGEVGLDYYWDITCKNEQQKAFRRQVELAVQYSLPLVIHSRKSLDDILIILNDMSEEGLTGVFHCFPGSLEQAMKAVKLGFKLGIGGVVTFKNSNLGHIISHVGVEHLILETDTPYIAPVPYRGKRNESAYIPIIAQSVADHLGVDLETVANITTRTALTLFGLPENNP